MSWDEILMSVSAGALLVAWGLDHMRSKREADAVLSTTFEMMDYLIENDPNFVQELDPEALELAIKLTEGINENHRIDRARVLRSA